jgi:hypothetical protein
MGETPNPVSCSLIPRYLSFGSCLPIQGKGFGDQGAMRLPVVGVGVQQVPEPFSREELRAFNSSIE